MQTLTALSSHYRLLVACALLGALVLVACQRQTSEAQTAQATVTLAAAPGVVLTDVPQRIDAKARYLFYLHGRIVEEQGARAVSPQFGPYEYAQILDTLAGRGFVVISEARPRGTDVQQYAPKVVEQINTLMKAGVPPGHITVVGASRGGVIAVAVSTRLKQRAVNFVILASCGNSDEYRRFKPDLWGNVLSIYDYKDDTGAGTCQRFFAQATGLGRHNEVLVKLGLGHGLLYRPLKEWVEPAVAWANQP